MMNIIFSIFSINIIAAYFLKYHNAFQNIKKNITTIQY